MLAPDAASGEQAIIMTHHQMALYLLEGIEYHTYKDEQRCTTKELSELTLDAEQSGECWKYGEESEEEGAWKCDSRHDGVEIVGSILSWLDSRDETVVALHVLSHLHGVDCNSRVQIGEEDNQSSEDHVVKSTLGVHQFLKC